jgi:hypothetical protein
VTNADTDLTSNEYFGGPTASSLKRLASQITEWRSMLPQELQWDENNPYGFSTLHPANMQDQLIEWSVLTHLKHSDQNLFTADLNSVPVPYLYAYDIQVALLRTRYYYTKYVIYRPFVYKALHFPERMSGDDAEGVAECLRVYALSILLYSKEPFVLSFADDGSPV